MKGAPMVDYVQGALGDGWLGKLVAFLAAFVIGWIAKRPIQQAAVLASVDAHIKMALNAQAEQIVTLTAKCERADQRYNELVDLRAEDRRRCDEELAAMRDEITRLLTRPTRARSPKK